MHAHTHARARVHMCTRAHMHTVSHAHTHIHTYTHTQAHTHIYEHTHIYTHTHTCINPNMQRTTAAARPEHDQTLEVHVRHLFVMKVNEAMAQLNDIILLDFIAQWRVRIHIEELTKGAIRRKHHDNFEEAHASCHGNDAIGWEDVWMGKPVDQMNLCPSLQILHNPLHLFERQPLERNLL